MSTAPSDSDELLASIVGDQTRMIADELAAAREELRKSEEKAPPFRTDECDNYGTYHVRQQG